MESDLFACCARFFSPIHSIASLEKVKRDLSEVGQITLSNFLLLQQYKVKERHRVAGEAAQAQVWQAG